MNSLVEGIRRFQSKVFPEKEELFRKLGSGQSPFALVVTCADSRIVPSLIMQAEPGELFLARNAGNFVPPYGEGNDGTVATVEYAAAVLKVPHIVVLGHTDCGAMRAALKPESTATVPSIRKWLSHADLPLRVVREAHPEASGAELELLLIRQNVLAQIDHLRTHPSVAARLATGNIQIHGWVYHIGSGNIDAWDEKSSSFRPVTELEQQISANAPASGSVA